MGEEVSMTENTLVIVGYCRPIVDRTMVAADGEAEPLLESLGVATGVSFVDDRLIDEAVLHLSTAEGISPEISSPGGPVSNALYSLANSLGPYPRRLTPMWTGPFPASAANSPVDPLPSLRSVGIRTVVQPANHDELPQSLCIVARDSGDTVAILVGNRQQMGVADELPSGHLAFTMISDLPAIIESTTAAGFALMSADIDHLDEYMQSALDAAAAAGKIQFLFGTLFELERLGFVVDGAIVDSRILGVEVIATDGERPVRVWCPGANAPEVLEVQSLVPTGGGFLGAGDAYTGTYLGARLQGMPVTEAHATAGAAARHASYHLRARAVSDTNLTELFGTHIDRASQIADWNLFTMVRRSAGTTVVSCLNTGIDEIGARIANEWGLAYYGLMPQGRRRDGGLIPLEHDVVELGTPSYRYCTWTNVFVSDGTVLVDITRGEGSAETRRAAQALNRPLLEIDLSWTLSRTFAAARLWSSVHGIRVVNVAGSRSDGLSDADVDLASAHIDAALRAAASLFEHGVPQWVSDREFASLDKSIIGIPRLAEVSTAVRSVLEQVADSTGASIEVEGLLWSLAETTIVRAKSRDLVRAVSRRELDAALVGMDMILDMPWEEVDVVAALGLFNSAVAVVAPAEQRRESGKFGAQYVEIAKQSVLANTHTPVPIEGAGEGWVAAGILDAVVDTFRTGQTARKHGLEWQQELARCPLCLIIPRGGTLSPAGSALVSRLARPTPIAIE